MTNHTKNTCPTCGAVIPGDAPGGLCPKCVLEGVATAPSSAGSGRHHSPPPGVAEIAPHFPELEIVELIGAGGMGAVYKARQPKLERTVAVKILSHDLSADPAFVERFNREAKVLARLSHPNIVTVFDFGTAGPFCNLLMEYVDGVNLRQAMRTGGFTPSEALALVQEICSALKFAHEEGILHRDIKPENILIDSKGRVKIADFGIAKLIGEGAPTDVTLTQQGSVLGSPHYMAPEQFESPGDIDQRADIYSLGVVLYEMLTGELPIGRFAAPSAKTAMDARIDAIVLRTLEKERQARFQSAQEVMTEVGAVVQNPGGARMAPAAAAAAPVSSDSQGIARFSLAAAILTGLSLVGVIAGAYVGAEYRGLGLTREAGRIVSIVVTILSAMTAITGFIFGCVALGSIRKSGGRLDGLGSSVFATALWPLLLLGAFGSLFLSMPQPSSGDGESVSFSVILLFLGSALLFSAFVLVRGLRRWARGTVDSDGGKRFPGLARPILTAVGLVVLGVVSLEILARLSPSGSDGSDPYADRFAEMEREMQQAPRSVSRGQTEEVRWRLGEPEIDIPFTVESGYAATMRLVIEEKNSSSRYVPLGECSENLNGAPGRGRLELGTVLASGADPVSATHDLTVLFSSDLEGSEIHTGEDLRGWIFNDTLNATGLDLGAAGTLRYPLATRFADGTDVATGMLYLEVITE